MKIKLKDKYEKIKKYLDEKSQNFYHLLIIRAKRFNIFKNEKQKKHYCFLFDIK